MPALNFMRPFTTRVINPVTRRFAGHLPGFAILVYSGRRSGRVYRTPMNVFRHGDDYVFALTYGSDVQWVRNVMAAGGCELEVRGKTVRLTGPQLFIDPTQRLMPLPVRFFLRLMRVTEFLSMRQAPPD
jgi:deazaflavin-dependent oxidoreductase (nitroreductase family)